MKIILIIYHIINLKFLTNYDNNWNFRSLYKISVSVVLINTSIYIYIFAVIRTRSREKPFFKLS